MTTVDLEPAVRRTAALIAAVPDDLLSAPTPCERYTVGDLIDHIGGFAIGFTAAAAKATGDGPPSAPQPGDASRLPADWRTRIPRDLAGLAEAWRTPDAWTGMTRAGSVELPGEVAGLFALDEVVVHGWDLARATGQPYGADDDHLRAILGLLTPFVASQDAGSADGIFGPAVAVDGDAPLLDRVLGLTGRDPAWSPLGHGAGS